MLKVAGVVATQEKKYAMCDGIGRKCQEAFRGFDVKPSYLL